MKKQYQKGIALPLVMIVIMLGALLVPPFLNQVSSGLLNSSNYHDELNKQYACDAAVEHAIWGIVYGDFTSQIPDAGNSISYDLEELVNGENVTVSISNSYDVLAWDDFEGGAGNWGWGEGWLDNWAVSGSPEITTQDSPQEGAGTYHLRMNNSDTVKRSVDLSDAIYGSVRFWYRQTNNFDGGFNPDHAYLEVSNDGVSYSTACEWTSSNNTYYSTYRHMIIPLTKFGFSDNFSLRFRADTDNGENFYVDALDIVWMSKPIDIPVQDNFETGNWAGGTGWLNNAPWTTTGSTAVNTGVWLWPTNYQPHGGSYQAQLRGGSYSGQTTISRALDASSRSGLNIKFWGRQTGFNSSDRLILQVSSDGGDTWQNAALMGRAAQAGVSRIDSTWRSFEVNLSGYDLTENFRIRFYCSFSGSSKYIWLDDVSFSTVYAYSITATADDRVLKVTLDLDSGTQEIVWWEYES